MSELLHMDFFVRALAMGLLLSVLFGILSFFVVLRKMAFMGAGISHTVFGGLAVGVLLNIDPFLSSLVFCMLSSFIISRLVRSGALSHDSGIGIFFSFSMGLGALLLSLRKAYTFDLSGTLFGNILGITPVDVKMTLAVTLATLPLLFVFFHRLLFMSLDETVARVSGVHTRALDSGFMLLLALVIVISVKMVGIILVTALAVLPASFSLALFRDYRKVIPCSILYCAVIIIGGLFLSYWADTPAGATMVVLGAVLYFLTLAAVHLKP